MFTKDGCENHGHNSATYRQKFFSVTHGYPKIAAKMAAVTVKMISHISNKH